MQQPFTNQSYRPPFNSNQNQGNFNPGYNQNVENGFNHHGFKGNQSSGNAPKSSSFRPPGFNQGPRNNLNLPFPPTQSHVGSSQEPPLFPSHPQPNPSTQPPPQHSNPNHHTAKANHLRSRTQYNGPPYPIDASLVKIGDEEGVT